MTDTLIKNKKKEGNIPHDHKRYKLQPIEVQQDVINRLARNESVINISKRYNVAHSSLLEFKAKHIDEIEKNRQELIECLPTALEIVQQDLKNGKKIAYRYSYNRRSITDNDLVYKKQIQTLVSDLFKMLGFFPHTNTSVHIGKFYQDNRTQVKITPEFGRFLDFREAEQVKVIEEKAGESQGQGDDCHKSIQDKDANCG